MQRTPRHLGHVGFALLLGLLVASIAAVGAEKAIPPERANPRLASSLQLLAEIATSDPSALQPRAEGSGIVLDGDRIDVIIEPTSGRVTSLDESAIRALGGTIEAQSDNLIRASVPVDRLVEIADHVSGVAYIREPYKPRPLVVTSQGVALTGASAFHSAGYTGVGIKVAIIDLGFDGLADAQAAGELAHVAYTWNYTTGTSNVETTGEIHGTAVAEIVADMAPGASLYLLLIGDEVDLSNAAQYCIDHGIRVINHSVAWYNTDYYDGTGDVAGVANDARDNNILWVNAAGNEAGDGHWQGAFTDTDGDGFLDFGTGSDYVDGDTRDEGARIYADSGDIVLVYMTWNDWTASNQDYDLYLYNSSGAIVASSTGNQSGYQQPTEAIYYSVPTSGYYEIVIDNYAAPAKPEIEFFAYLDSGDDPGMQHHIASSSIIEPANSAKVVATGAISRYNWTSGPIESFSSRGPSNASKYAASITKPDLCGVDGVSSYTYGSFYGTSAASPHVAGAAALLLSEDPTRTASALQTLLEGSAIDMGTSGKDNTYGSGRLNLELTSDESVHAYWKMNEGSGATTADASGNGHTGTITGASWTTSTDGSGALSFDGAGDYVQVPTASGLNFSGAFTVEAWIRPAVLSGYRAIVVKRGTTSQAAYGLWTSGSNIYAEVKNYDRSSVASILGNTSLSVGTWYHVALVRSAAGEVSLWVNGVKQTTTGAVTGSVNPPQDLYIGRQSASTSQDFSGRIDEVRMHARALLSSEFNTLGADSTAPALATNFAASDGADGQSALTWTNPSDSDLGEVVVQRNTGSYPTSHTSGTNVYDNVTPTPGGAVSTTDTGLTNDTTYYYAVFSRDSTGNWNDTVTAGSNADTGTPTVAAGGDGPVGYWEMNEGSGTTTADASGNGHVGTIVGATWTTSTDGSGALSFDGAGDYVQVPTASGLNFSGAFTVEAWIRPAVLSGYRAIVVKRGTTSQAAYGLWTSGSNIYAEVKNYDRSSVASILGNTSLSVGTWYHVALVRSAAGEVSLWVNGVKQTTTGAVTGSVNPPQDLYIGRQSASTSQDFSGRIDEVRMHARALLSSEFNTLGASSAAERAVATEGEALRARVRPNPASDIATFEVLGADAERISVTIWNLAGRRVFESGWQAGSTIEWNLRDDDGDQLAAGAYVYRIAVELDGGLIFTTPPQKVFLQR